MRDTSAPVSATILRVMSQQEKFWNEPATANLHDLLRYSFFLGFFPFAGYLFSYTIRGTIWNYWPFVQTTLGVESGLVFAALQWILFSIFPMISSLILELMTSRFKEQLEFQNCAVLVTYSITPLCLAALFIGVPYFDLIATTLGFATFLYLLYYGFRYFFRFTIVRSSILVLLLLVLFVFFRELFVFAIGF
jgi:hypothetical protein